MDKETFSYLIVNPSEIGASDVQALERVTADYPFFQLAHSLLAKGHYEINNNELATEKLRKAAAYALSRNALRKLINGELANELSKFSHTRLSISRTENKQEKPAELSPIQALRAIDYTDSLLVEEKQRQTDESSQKEQKVDFQEQNQIIERFIQIEKSIRPIRAKQGELPEAVEDLAEKTSPTALNLVTESFAKIQAKQGNYAKAIETYEKLILKFPQKKAYFAAKIEELNAKRS
ncbi:MAG: hypothetical protein U0Y10_19115 [Spirosomataceae bacterium]